MAENTGVHRVLFTNTATQTVTFVVEVRSGPQTAFTLVQNETHYKEVQIPSTHEQLRLVVGENSNGRYTNESVSTDELPGLGKVVVTRKPETSDNFVLEKHKKTNEGNLVTNSWLRWSRSRNEGAPRDRLDVV